MLSRLKIKKNTKERIKENDLFLTQNDVDALWNAVRFGLVTQKTLHLINYQNYKNVSHLSYRLTQLCAHGYLQKANYNGPAYGNNPKDYRVYLPTQKALHFLGINQQPRRIDKKNAWAAYFSNKVFEHLNLSSVEQIYTAVELKSRSALNQKITERYGDRVTMPLWAQNAPFHLAIRSKDNFYYIYFIKSWVAQAKKDISRGAINPYQSIREFTALLPTGDKYFIACPKDHYVHNARNLAKQITDTRSYITTYDTLVAIMLPVLTDSLVYRNLIRQEFEVISGIALFDQVKTYSGEIQYAAEVISGSLFTMGRILSYDGNRIINILCLNNQKELFNKANPNLKVYSATIKEVEEHYRSAHLK